MSVEIIQVAGWGTFAWIGANSAVPQWRAETNLAMPLPGLQILSSYRACCLCCSRASSKAELCEVDSGRLSGAPHLDVGPLFGPHLEGSPKELAPQTCPSKALAASIAPGRAGELSRVRVLYDVGRAARLRIGGCQPIRAAGRPGHMRPRAGARAAVGSCHVFIAIAARPKRVSVVNFRAEQYVNLRHKAVFILGIASRVRSQGNQPLRVAASNASPRGFGAPHRGHCWAREPEPWGAGALTHPTPELPMGPPVHAPSAPLFSLFSVFLQPCGAKGRRRRSRQLVWLRLRPTCWAVWLPREGSAGTHRTSVARAPWRSSARKLENLRR